MDKKQTINNVAFIYSMNMLKLLLSMELITKEEFDRIVRISVSHYETEKILIKEIRCQ